MKINVANVKLQSLFSKIISNKTSKNASKFLPGNTEQREASWLVNWKKKDAEKYRRSFDESLLF